MTEDPLRFWRGLPLAILIGLLMWIALCLVIRAIMSDPACKTGDVATEGYYENGHQEYQYTNGSAWVNVWDGQVTLWSRPQECQVTDVCVEMDNGTTLELEPVNYGGWTNNTTALIDSVVVRTQCYFRHYLSLGMNKREG